MPIVLLGVMAGGWALRDAPTSCSGEPLLLNVAAQPDIAPAMMEIAARFNVRGHQVHGRCVAVEISERGSGQVARMLSGRGPAVERGTLDGWVPESSMWMTVARGTAAGASRVAPDAPSVASSPVVLATPRPVADDLRRRKIGATWRMVFPRYAGLFGGPAGSGRLSVQMLDPSVSATGIATLIAARGLVGQRRNAGPLLTAFVRGMQRNVSARNSGLFTYLTGIARLKRPLVVTTEQSVVTFNETHLPTPAVALVPREGTILMDYPFVVTAEDQERRDAVAAFRSAVRSRVSQETIRRFGFRTPQGMMTGDTARRYDLDGLSPRLLGRPTPGQVGEALQTWNRLGLGSRLLVLTDISGSVNEPVPGQGMTRLQLAGKAALIGLRLFPAKDTDIGLWAFSTNLVGDRDYKELVPLGPLTEHINGRLTRRQVLRRVFTRVRAKPDGDTGLYDSILAAYRTVRRSWNPDKFNAVLVMTDGKNDDPHGITLRGLEYALRHEMDPRRPVQVIIVAFGPDVDPGPMREIAQLTNGAAYTTKDPTQIINVFMEAIGRRLCAPNCGPTGR